MGGGLSEYPHGFRYKKAKGSSMKPILSLCLILLAALATPSADAALPNIVFILADDLGAGDLGCYNKDSKVPTPNMDKIAAAGIRFNDAHSPSSVCTPTRYGVLTGRYCWRSRLKSGVLWGDGTLLISPARLTVGKLLQQAGYATAHFGKWHLGAGKDAPAQTHTVSTTIAPSIQQERHGRGETLNWHLRREEALTTDLRREQTLTSELRGGKTLTAARSPPACRRS